MSPDGAWIAYSTNRHGYFAIETTAIDGMGREVLTEGSELDVSPLWSPDGAHIAFLRYGDLQECSGPRAPWGHYAEFGLYTMKADGSELRRVVHARYEDTMTWNDLRGVQYLSDLAWSPDGQLLAFVGQEEVNGLVWTATYTVGVDGSGLGRADELVVDSRWRSLPSGETSASPDGLRIARVIEEGSSGVALYTTAADGSDERAVARKVRRRNDAAVEAAYPGTGFYPVDPAWCTGGVVVPDPEANLGLVRDCEVLLAVSRRFSLSAELNWNKDTPMSQWEGISFEDPFPLESSTSSDAIALAAPRVRHLSLSDFGVWGTVPAQLGELTELRSLDISSNEFSGPIPPELGDLAELRVLDISDTDISGCVPSKLREVIVGYTEPNDCNESSR